MENGTDKQKRTKKKVAETEPAGEEKKRPKR